MLIIKFRRWLDSNHGPLVLEATSLPTDPQPLPLPLSLFKTEKLFMSLGIEPSAALFISAFEAVTETARLLQFQLENFICLYLPTNH